MAFSAFVRKLGPFGGQRVVCETHSHGHDQGKQQEEGENVTVLFPTAYPEHLKKAPITPKQDDETKAGVYKWGFHPVPESQRTGGRPHNEEYDNQSHNAQRLPWPTDLRAFHPNTKPEADRINTQYENMLGDQLPLGGFNDKPRFAATWQKQLAYHHGLYVPSKHQETKPADDIRLAVSNYSDRVHADAPKDACKYLQIEQFRCMQTYQVDTDPNGATTKCLKWFNEWTQCAWDQEKLVRGHNYIERRHKGEKRRYFAAPDYQHA